MIIGCKEYLGQPISCDFHGKLGSKDVAEQVCMERGKPLFTVLSAKFKMFFQDYSLLLTEMIIKEDLLQKGEVVLYQISLLGTNLSWSQNKWSLTKCKDWNPKLQMVCVFSPSVVIDFLWPILGLERT